MKQIIPVKQGDNITLTVNGLGSSGEGVGKYEGFTVFVKGALPEEEVRVTITLVKKAMQLVRWRRLSKHLPSVWSLRVRCIRNAAAVSCSI